MSEPDFSLIGLTRRDIAIYEALLSIKDGASIRAVAERTGQNRGTTYESIKKLIKLGLVSYFKVGSRRQFVAANPDVLIDLIREKQNLLAKSYIPAQNYVKEIRDKFDTETRQSFATFYEGDEGIASILRDVLMTAAGQTPREYRTISTARVREYIYNNFPNFTHRRIAEEIFVQVIAVGDGGRNDELSQRRWLKQNDGVIPRSYTIIYGDKTAMISLGEMNFLRGIVIDNAAITSLQREQFEIIWRSLESE